MRATLYVFTTVSLPYCSRHQRAWVASLDQWVAFSERAMYAAPLRWMADSLSTATRSFCALLRVVSRKLLRALASRHRVHTPARTSRPPQPASVYTMLVESDVQRGMRGILP